MKLALEIVAGIFVIWLLSVLFILPYGNDKESAKGTACLSNTKQQGLALMLYGEDNSGRYPPHGFWKDLSKKYLAGESSKYALRCPLVAEGAFGYAFNSALSGQKEPSNPELVPMCMTPRICPEMPPTVSRAFHILDVTRARTA
ncbi:hypothetical protein EON82_01440 [bacterium]|nr:MAG: hypothetical protein EON82_01440 [bacterium]